MYEIVMMWKFMSGYLAKISLCWTVKNFRSGEFSFIAKFDILELLFLKQN